MHAYKSRETRKQNYVYHTFVMSLDFLVCVAVSMCVCTNIPFQNLTRHTALPSVLTEQRQQSPGQAKVQRRRGGGLLCE